jgi:hypothetical protein
VDNQSRPLVDKPTERLFEPHSTRPGGMHRQGSAVARRQFKRSPYRAPDDLAWHSVGERFHDRALAQRREAVLRRPHPEVTRTEVELQTLP